MTEHVLVSPRLRAAALSAAALLLLPATAAAHEAWLLTPAEIEALAVAPIPALFQSRLWLGLSAMAGAAGVMAAITADLRLASLETRLAAPLARRAADVGPLVLRLGLAAMLALAATGGLPRHGTALWTQPTFLVPDMQLALVPGWDALAPLQFVLAALLAAGLATRAAGLVLVALAVLGFGLFGAAFASYAPHFAAPGLMLVLCGAGAGSLDRSLGIDGIGAPSPAATAALWRAACILVGGGFVYLALAYKLTQPTLLIAILDHGDFPRFGLSYPVVALVMTWVEIVCGTLLVLGRAVRPVALTIAGAITFLALTLGETPLFHANLYGCMALLALAGRDLALPVPLRWSGRRAAA
ncbi:hypothetical protein [Roseivivax isoporae]|uniref:DoxX family protein n=1 Tax=Roseivivax isoporae LMG 25204 TaxID=1449351 RepID=X7F5B3_9RHOB|nr:hypothetical protein [Roseivivax isoporae]ETX27264.1 hypothetical protein RISW2_14790 [Roseivivax isoporae LMG 25204]